MSNSIAPGSSADVNVKVTALTTNPNVPVTYKTIILKKNLVNGVNTLTQEMMSAQNTKYVIKYDYVLGEDITIPTGCVLEFDGGSISGEYTLTGTNTIIKSVNYPIFTGVSFAGTWNCSRITSVWLSDVTTNNRVRQLFNLAQDSVHNKIVIEEGNYHLSVSGEAETCLIIPSNTDVIINGTITLASNANESYMILFAQDKENIHLSGNGKIVGDVDTHTGTTGEWGIGLGIYGSRNVYVEGLIFEKCWGDGIYIGPGDVEEALGDSVYASKNIFIKNVKCDNNRRQGISVTHARNVFIEDSILSNTGQIEQTNPCFGIDVEPRSDENKKESADNVQIIGCTFKNNYNGGFVVQGVPTYITNIKVIGCNFTGQKVKAICGVEILNCINIDNLYLSAEYETAPKIIVRGSEVNYVEIRGTQNMAVDLLFDSCICGKTPQDEFIYKNSYSIKDNIRITNSIIKFINNLNRNIYFDNIVCENCEIIGTDTTYDGAVICATLRNCHIVAGSLLVSIKSDFYGCVIEPKATPLMYFSGSPNINFIDNIILNGDSIPLIQKKGTASADDNTLIVDQKLTAAQNTVGDVSTYFDVVKNRVQTIV